jgi:CspA family cold shock protein
MHATVKFYVQEKGFGFAIPDDGGPDVFVHGKQIAGGGYLCPGDVIEYTVGLNKRTGGQEAKAIRIIQTTKESDSDTRQD